MDQIIRASNSKSWDWKKKNKVDSIMN